MPAKPSIAPRPHNIPWTHLVLAFCVVAVWGTNFVVTRVALDTIPPLLFATLRFALAFFPAALFVRRPNVAWGPLAAYGILIGVGQFGLIYIAMNGYISPGLASLVVQMQVFFTIGLAMWFDGEQVQPFQIVALLFATGGMLVIALHGGGSATPFGLILVLIGAVSWAGGNQVARASRVTNMLGFVIWASLFSVPPLLLGSFLFEGKAAIFGGLARAGVGTWIAVFWQSAGNTMFGYGAWGWLLARHPAAEITPTAMLVPIFGMGASALLLGESLPGWKLTASALVLLGLAINVLYPVARRLSALPWRRGASGG